MGNNRKDENLYQSTDDIASDIVRMCAYHRSHECLMDDKTYITLIYASELLRAYSALKDAAGRLLDHEEIVQLSIDATAPVCMALGRVLAVERGELT